MTALPTINLASVSASASGLAATMTENQRSVASIWSIVSSTYYNPMFNGLGDHGWHDAETCALEAVADTGPEDNVLVVDAINTMLLSLGDPYTRYLPKKSMMSSWHMPRAVVPPGI